MSRRTPLIEAEIHRFDLREVHGFPLDSPLPDAQAIFMIYTTIQVMNQLDDEARGLVNHTIWEAPATPLVASNRSSWDNNQLVPWTGAKTIWVELTINNVDVNGHPFHLVSSIRCCILPENGYVD